MQIFFPRSIQGEIEARDAAREQKRSRSLPAINTLNSLFGTRTDMSQSRNAHGQASGGTYLLTSSPVKQSIPLDMYDAREEQQEQRIQRAGSTDSKHWPDNEQNLSHLPRLPPIRPNRKRGESVEHGGIEFKLTEANVSQHNLGSSTVHPMIHNFTSPIGS
jgi:hypothetical protein